MVGEFSGALLHDLGVATFPDHAVLLLHVSVTHVGFSSKLSVLDEKVQLVFLHVLDDLGARRMIRVVVEHTPIDTLTQGLQNESVDHLVETVLLVGLEEARLVVDSALVNLWNTAQLTVIVRETVLVVQWLDDVL